MFSCTASFTNTCSSDSILLQPAQPIDAIVRDDFAVGEDHHVGAHLLDHFDDVRAHQDGAAFVGERPDHACAASARADTSRPENGSSRTISSGLCSSADASCTFCRMPFENADSVEY